MNPTTPPNFTPPGPISTRNCVEKYIAVGINQHEHVADGTTDKNPLVVRVADSTILRARQVRTVRYLRVVYITGVPDGHCFVGGNSAFGTCHCS